MAKVQRQTANPLEPLHKAVSRFHEQALLQIQKNLVTQTVWPTEIYPGFRVINAARKATGSWYSTGDGAKSFTGRVVSASAIGNVTLEYSFNEYMRYAELGVGKGVSAEDVSRSKKANYRRRYISKWNRKLGHSHRPAIMMELRHLSTRLENYALDFYGYEAQFRVMDVFDGMKIDIPI